MCLRRNRLPGSDFQRDIAGGLGGGATASPAATAARERSPTPRTRRNRCGAGIPTVRGGAWGWRIAGAVTLLDLDLVVIGGGVAAAGPLLFEPLEQSYTRYAALGFAAKPRVVPAQLGGAAGLVGAAAVVLAPEAYWPAAIHRRS